MGNQSRLTPSQLLLSLFAMDQSQVEQFINADMTKNNETLLGSMKSILDSSLSDMLKPRFVLLSRAMAAISVKATVLYTCLFHYCTRVLGRNMQNKPNGSMYGLSVV